MNSIKSSLLKEMKLSTPLGIKKIPLPTEREFRLISDFVYDRLGIYWEAHKKDLAYSRLRIRLQKLNLSNFMEYYNYLLSKEGSEEIQIMINAVTTNKTEFYREKAQFDFLENTYFKDVRVNASLRKDKKIRIWSAACSSGEEPYTLALIANECLGIMGTAGWDLRILASDVNTEVLEIAENGVYCKQDISVIPVPLLEKYFKIESQNGYSVYKVKEKLKSIIQFRCINFFDKRYPIKTKFDLIFCRNVLIYFDSKTQKTILKRLHDYLNENGYLFLGGSEALTGVSGFERLKNNIYRKIQN